MKKIIIFFITLFLAIFLTYISSYSNANKMCKENPRQMCMEYENFLEFLLNPKTEKLSADLLYVLNDYNISTDNSKSDPLCDDFYK